MAALLVAAGAGLLIGVALGALGAGGSVLAVPAFVYLLDQSAAQATTGSLVVVGVTSLAGAVSAHRDRRMLLGRGVAFGLVATGGAVVGALASSRVPEPVLLGSFAALVVVVAAVMTKRLVTASDERRHRPAFDAPIITISPRLSCQCPRALTVLVTATAVGLLTGFLGVGGGFLVVPALVLVLSVPMEVAAGTSLVVISITSATALLVRAGNGPGPDWSSVALLATLAVAGSRLGARVALRAPRDRLQAAFAGLLLTVGVYTGCQALPALS